MSKRLATVEVHWQQNKRNGLHISRKVSQHIANQLAVRYLELLDEEQQQKRFKASTTSPQAERREG